MSFELADITAIGSFVVAALALIATMLRSHRADSEKDQMLKDRLEQISEITRETRDSVREINRKLDDHSTRIARVEESVKALDRRVERLELMSTNIGIGGTTND